MLAFLSLAAALSLFSKKLTAARKANRFSGCHLFLSAFITALRFSECFLR